MYNNVEILIVSISLSIAIFVLLREVFCWYFKINKRISLLCDIKDELVQANRYANFNKDPEHMPCNSSGGVGCDSPSYSVGGSGGAAGKLGAGYNGKHKSTFWRAE
jgi:hypothetical protein